MFNNQVLQPSQAGPSTLQQYYQNILTSVPSSLTAFFGSTKKQRDVDTGFKAVSKACLSLSLSLSFSL
jgi:hypothetical protein